MAVFEPVMMDFQQNHNVYKFQFAVSIVFHKAVDPAVVTQPPVTLTLEMVAVDTYMNRMVQAGFFIFQTLFHYN